VEGTRSAADGSVMQWSSLRTAVRMTMLGDADGGSTGVLSTRMARPHAVAE